MDLTNPAVIAIVAVIASAVTTALTNLLMAWLGRRRSAAETAKAKAETDKINTDTRRSLAEEDRAAMAHLIKVLEGSYNVKVGDLTQGMEALEKSHATELKSMTGKLTALTEEVAGLKTLVEGANKTINEQGATIKEQSAELTEVRQELAIANETITALNNQVADLKGLMITANETIASLKQVVSDLINQIKGMGAVPVAAAESETAGPS